MDGRLVVDLSVSEAMGGSGEPGTNPEQLFAVSYAACFQPALSRSRPAGSWTRPSHRSSAGSGSARPGTAASG